MKRLTAALVCVPFAISVAQDERDASTPFAWAPPDEASPFFMSSEVLQTDESVIEAATSPASQYPIVRKTPDPAWVQMRNFFTGMFDSVNLRGAADSREAATLTLNPASPNLAETREVDVAYSVRNTSRQMARLEFPTGQQIEIQTKNPAGAVVERWSDDRSFPQGESIVIINPDERIEYREKIPTRELKAGTAYEVEAFLKTEPDQRRTAPLDPR